VDTRVEVSGGENLCEAKLQDLSRAGARVLAPVALGAPGETIELFLPSPGGGEEIGVMGEIVTAQETPQGHMISLRFVLVQPGQDGRLAELIRLLRPSEAEVPRQTPRAMRRLPLAPPGTSPAQLRALLGDVSRGSVVMAVSDQLALNDEVLLVVSDAGGEDLLQLPSRVTSIRSITKVKDDDRGFRVALELTPPGPEQQELISRLLSELAAR
jgi:hypothetical protein